MDWGEVLVDNTSDREIVVDDVELLAGPDAGSVALIDARVAETRGLGNLGTARAHTGKAGGWPVEPVPAKGARISPARSGSGSRSSATYLVLTVKPAQSGLAWIDTVRLRYHQGSRRYVQTFGYSLVFCASDAAADLEECKAKLHDVVHVPLALD